MHAITVNGEVLVPDHEGALFWPRQSLLVVADMHLEKGSAFAARGQFLPPYDSAVTMASLARQISRFKPERLVALGDSFHDTRAGDRMDERCLSDIATLAKRLELHWITGNHDPEIPHDLPGLRHEQLVMGPLVFRHEPLSLPQQGEIAGHLHPVAKVVTPKGKLRTKAFVTDGTRLVMPSFGAYTGGLNLRDPAIDCLFNARSVAVHVCGKTRVYPVPQNRLFPD